VPEDLGERTEEATPKRLSDAREEGNVPKSADAAAATMLLGVTLLLWLALAPSLLNMAAMLAQFLGADRPGDLLLPEDALNAALEAGAWAARVAAPILLIAWAVAYLSHFWQVGWLISLKSIHPRLQKLNPISGFRRIFGVAGVVKAGMDGTKVLIVLGVVVGSIVGMMDEIVLMPHLAAGPAIVKIGWMSFDLALRVVAVLLFLGIVDYAYQRWKHRRDLRMSKVEVKEEFKQTEGDPETRKRRLRMQRQIAMQRISSAVPKADVVVTNPDHISIAIAYEPERMNAPRVVAKGQDYVALRIRQIAMKHGIPIVERAPLARALYRQVKVGQEVPPDFYQAVAEILAYVYRLSGRLAGAAR
jgi:flagellar biosynthetic protein FlhB